MTVRYANTIPDMLALNVHTYMRNPTMLGLMGVGFAIITYANFTAFAGMKFSLPTVITFLIFEVGVLLFLAGITAVSLTLIIIAGHTRTSRAEHTITLADDHFTEETVYNKTEHRWNGVQKITRTRKHLFVYISAFAAHAIPRRAFADEREWNAFYEYCIQRAIRA